MLRGRGGVLPCSTAIVMNFVGHPARGAVAAMLAASQPAPSPPPPPPPRTRSRSARRPLRPGAPDRRSRRHGTLPLLTSPAARADALAEFHADVYSASSRASLGFKLRTVTRLFADWGVELCPPTVEKVYLLGTSLKAGGYRSADSYLSLYRSTCARHGHGFGPELAVAARDAARLCNRGLGGPVRATPLPLRQLHRLSGSRDPWVRGGPCSPRNALVTGTWWLLREIELSRRSGLAW